MNNTLICRYHGWQFDNHSGACTSLAGMAGRTEKICLKAYPAQTYAGWVWAFPGDPALANSTPLPTIQPYLEIHRYHPLPMEGFVNCHFSYITENATDLFHADLHKAQQPWANPRLESLEHDNQRVKAVYDVETPNPLAGLFSNSRQTQVHVLYEYPYIHIYQKDLGFYLFVTYLPTGPQSTYVHSTFFFKKPAGTRILLQLLHPVLEHLMFRRVFEQDIRAVEEEQRAYNLSQSDQSLETNPVTHAVRQVILHQTAHVSGISEEPRVLFPGRPL